MGGGSYERDVSSTPVRREQVFSYSGHRSDAEKAKHPERREVHDLLNIKGKILECCDSKEHPETTPIVIVMDVTRSRGEDAVVIYNKMPLLIGQLKMSNIIGYPVISLGAIGDASSGDQAPLQISQFESDKRVDEALSKIWLEEGGGGNGKESYELAAYYYARKTKLDATKRRKKGFLFILGDEGFYDPIPKDQIKVWIGDEIASDVSARIIFDELQRKFEVFFIYPKKPWDDKVADIDAEIATRVKNAGGMIEGVSIRASLLWNNFNDLDLHVVDPCGHHIYYGSYCKRNGRSAAPCGGYLDVDMNVQGETTKPVENTRWEKGKAPKGHYTVYVQNYATHGNCAAKTPFRVEIEIDGKVQHFEGETPAGKTHEVSDTPVYEFDYDPKKGLLQSEDKKVLYSDATILGQWSSVLPQENILIVQDPKACVDAMLGAITLVSGKMSLDDYLKEMKGRGQTKARCEDIQNALLPLSKIGVRKEVDEEVFSRKRKTASKRSRRI